MIQNWNESSHATYPVELVNKNRFRYVGVIVVILNLASEKKEIERRINCAISTSLSQMSFVFQALINCSNKVHIKSVYS